MIHRVIVFPAVAFRPAAKNADEAKGKLGQMRFRQFAKEGPASGAREAKITIGHSRLWQDDSFILAIEGGISISEDPNIRLWRKAFPRRG